MIQHHHWSLEEIENMMPWEREIYLTLLSEWIKKEEEARKQEEMKYKY